MRTIRRSNISQRGGEAVQSLLRRDMRMPALQQFNEIMTQNRIIQFIPLSPVKLQRQPDLPHQFSKSRIRTKSIVERSYFDPDQPGIVFFISLIETSQRSILFAQARIEDRQVLLEPGLPV